MSKKKGGGGMSSDDFKQEDILQAIVIIDNFDRTFLPNTVDKPRALMPLVNAPLIEYTLHCLSAGGVEQAIIYCCTNADQIKAYFSKSKWTAESDVGMSVRLIVAEECTSVGDVLRDVENKSLVHTDFILVSGDLVSNVKLMPIVEEHKRRRAVSKNAIMTVVYKHCPYSHPSRSNKKDLLLTVQSKTQHIVTYQRVGAGKKFILDLSVFDTPLVELHTDLVDCRIAICSPVVPQLMTDNFDYLTIDDLIRGILVSEEILDNTVHINILGGDQYAVSVTDPFIYATASQDVMCRRTYPITADVNMLGSQPEDNKYVYKGQNVYQHREVTLELDCSLKRNVSIARGCMVGSASVISWSVLGRNCRIGKNVVIKGCYLWDDVIVDDNSVLIDSIVENNVKIGSHVNVGPNCILGRDVVISSKTELVPRSTYITKSNHEAISSDNYGSYKKRFVAFENGADDTTLRFLATEDGLDSGWGSGVNSEDDDDSDGSCNGSGGELNEAQEDEDDDAYMEVIHTLERALVEKIDTDNVILEVNGIKHAFGIQMRDLTMIVTKAFLDLPLRSQPLVDASSRDKYLERFKKHFQQFRTLFLNYVKTRESEVTALVALEEFASESTLTDSAYVKLLTYLYNENVISEEAIEEWWKREDEEESNEQLRKTVEPFVKWLEAAEEESD